MGEQVYQCPTCGYIYTVIQFEMANFRECPRCGVLLSMAELKDVKDVLRRGTRRDDESGEEAEDPGSLQGV